MKLNLCLDRHGLTCVGGRLEKTPLAIDIRHSIILLRSERVTELFKLHRKSGHLSASKLHHEARQQYWIPKGRIAIQRAYHLCYPVTVAEN